MTAKKSTSKKDHEFKKKKLDTPADAEAVAAATVSDTKKKSAPKKKKVAKKKTTTKKTSKKKAATKKAKKPVSKKVPVAAPEPDEGVSTDEDVQEDLVSTSVDVAAAQEVVDDSVASAPEGIVLDDQRRKDIDDDLREIYSDKDGELPDMTTFQTKRQGGLLRAFIVLLMSLTFLAGVAWFGFFTFQPQARFSEQDVILSVHGPEEIAIGEEVRYRIKFTNDQAVPLTQATLQVRYPAGFVFASSSIPATNDANDTWQLGSIEERRSDAIEISGRLYGDVATEQSLRVFFNYTPSNFSSEFQKVESARTAFTESPIALAISGPEVVGVGAPAEWTIELSGQDDEETVEVLLEFPDGFTLNAADPAADEQAPRQWTFDGTASGTRSITLQGMFDEAGERTIRARAFVPLDDAETELERVEVTTAESLLMVSDTDVITNLLINGVMGDFGIIAGETLNSTIVVQNAGELPMEDVSVRFTIDSPSDGSRTLFDWLSLIDDADGTISAEQRGPETRRATITWTSAQIPALANLAPGEEVQINFALPILSPTEHDLTAFTSFVSAASADIQYTQNDERDSSNTAPMNVTINSDLRFDTQHTITVDDDNVETHKIIYILENSFHGLEDIRLSTDLYGDITVGEFVLPAGEAEYNEDASTLTWTIDQMPLGVDILPFEFEVVLNEKNPSQTNLTSKVRIQAKDVITGETITIVGSAILLGGDDIPDDIAA